MAKVAVVFHSGYGHTQRMAQSVAQGAGADLITIDAEGNVPEAAWDTLAAADAYAAGAGYRAGRDMRLIVHDSEHGEVERHRCDIGMIEQEPA